MKPIPLLLLSIAFLGACSRQGEPAATAAALPPARVQLATVRIEAVPVLTEITGLIRPAQRAQLAAKVMGAIEEVPVALGQRVHQGDILVKISAAEIGARVAQAQSQANAARRDYERERDLLAKGASTADLVKGLQDRLAAADAQVREAETMLGYTRVCAPFDGVIARKFANAGDLASPGFPLLEIEGTADFQVEAGIPDSLAARLQPGAALAIEVPAIGITFTGKLVELSSTTDPNALTVLAKIEVPPGVAVRSGQFARVQVPATSTEALLVPASAVSDVGQLQRVFVADESRHAVLRLVKTGGRRGERIEILSGLDNGEQVVTAAPVGLREGQPLLAQ